MAGGERASVKTSTSAPPKKTIANKTPRIRVRRTWRKNGSRDKEELRKGDNRGTNEDDGTVTRKMGGAGRQHYVIN